MKFLKIYKINLSNTERGIIGKIVNSEVRNSTMSIYSYIINICKGESQIQISYSDFLKRYNRCHKKISVATLCDRMALLEQMNLLNINRESKVNIYTPLRKNDPEHTLSSDYVAAEEKQLRTFTDRELNLFNLIEKDKIRLSAMSIFSYFIKLSYEEKSDYVEISARRFLNRYKHYHKSMTPKTFLARVELLQELGLLEITKQDKGNIYKINRKLDNNSNDKKAEQSLIESDLEDDANLHNTISPKQKNNYIYTNTCIASTDAAVTVAKEVLKELGIKSKWVINNTIRTVKEYYKTINVRGAFAYISKIIRTLQATSKAIFCKTNAAIRKNNKFKKPKKQLKFNSYGQSYQRKNTTQEDAMLEAEMLYIDHCEMSGGNPILTLEDFLLQVTTESESYKKACVSHQNEIDDEDFFDNLNEFF